MTDSPPTPPPEVTWESPTKELLRAVLMETKHNGVCFKFTCPRGDSKRHLDRLRMMLSRTRKELERNGQRFKQFRLMSEVHPLVNTSMELIVLWQSQTSVNQTDEFIMRALSAKPSES